MSVSEESTASELSIPSEEEEEFNIGLYIGERNAQCERHGRGWAILPNGDQYDGQYRHGRRHGIGLYVFKDGPRYFGKYRCGHRAGRGIFIYPDGTMYEGNWRKGLKHGKGRYMYSNGDVYTGDWYRGQRHGVGIYTIGMSGACNIRFKGTWHNGIRVGPFEVYFGGNDKNIVLHGTWDKDFPQGPAVFSFDQRYMLLGYFQTPSEAKQPITEENEFIPDENEEELPLPLSPSIWYAQDICVYDYAQLPQEPVPLPLSDSDISVCSLSTVPTEITLEPTIICVGEGEGEEEAEECIPCECECDMSDIESVSEPCTNLDDPCAIEIVTASKC